MTLMQCLNTNSDILAVRACVIVLCSVQQSSDQGDGVVTTTKCQRCKRTFRQMGEEGGWVVMGGWRCGGREGGREVGPSRSGMDMYYTCTCIQVNKKRLYKKQRRQDWDHKTCHDALYNVHYIMCMQYIYSTRGW